MNENWLVGTLYRARKRENSEKKNFSCSNNNFASLMKKECENIDLDDYDNFLAHFLMFMHIYVLWSSRCCVLLES